MVRVLYNPKRGDDEILYTFEGEVVIAEYKGVTDTFDFSELKDGDLVVDIKTTLETNPITRVARKDGIIHLFLVHFHGKDATEEERYPEWMEVE